jgi:amino acid adenylation domain-containing protein
MPDFIPVDFNPFVDDREIEKLTITNEPQREIWLACMLGEHDANLSYNESVSLKISGKLDVRSFKKAVDNLVLRHEALRATVSPNGESLIIYKQLPVGHNIEDISHLSATEQEKYFASFLKREMAVPLDIYEGPLFRVFLHILSANDFYFTIIKHHIIGDGWSTGIMLEDLSKMYNAYSNGKDIELDAASQISDYASAQIAFRSTKEYRETNDYWLNLYKDHVPVLDLPTDHPRISPRTYKGKRIDDPISKTLADELKTTGAKAGASLVTTLLAAFEVFLYQQTHQRDIVVGLPSSGQAASGLTNVVGHCVNLLPLKTYVDPELSFTDYLKKRKKEVLDAYDHQRLTFSELLKKLYIPRDASRVTLVPVMFNVDMGMDNAVTFDGLDFKLISNPREYESSELFLNATRSKDGIVMEWSFNTGLFEDATIKKFIDGYNTILQTIVNEPGITISALTGVSEIQDAMIVEDIYIPDEETLLSLFGATAKKYADKNAVTFNEQQLSYQQLNEKTDQLAGYLVQQGIKRGDIVGLSVDRSMDMLLALLAILKAGAAYLPLDPEYPLDRIEFMLADSSATMLLTSANYKNKYQTKATEVVLEEVLNSLNKQTKFDKITLSGNDLAYVLYTSGSTGKPKGVKIKHRNLVNFLISMQQKPGISDSDRLLGVTTISFDIAGLELYLPIISGAEFIIADSETVRDGRLLISALEEKNITIMSATPATWQMMIDSGWQKHFDLKVLSSGEALPKDLAYKILPLCTTLWNMYGPTETTIFSTGTQVLADDKILTIGKPINNTQIYIVDEHGKSLSANVPGEIYIGGDGVAEGYLNRPELTAEKFVPDTFSKRPGAKLYRTGDLAQILDNGNIQYLGRIDHQVKIRGHRIELGEIEYQLSKQNGVKQSVVIAREDTPMNKRLVAYVTLNEDIAQADNSWKERWDTLYGIGAEGKNSEDSDQNIDGTLLKSLDSEELRQQSVEWLKSSTDRIKQLNAKRIYEIGSGAGQILFELAPDIELYIATDYADTAIVNLNKQLRSESAKWRHVRANTAAADDFSAIAGTPVDLVLIHSVAQYFPNADYLISVIKESAKAISSNGGCIFVGDMQGKNSLTMFHAMDHLPRSSDQNTLEEFKNIVANRVRIEEEFVADPAFFYGLPELLPEITGVDIQLRKGQLLNETTNYHYDVWLYVNTPVNKLIPQVTTDWKDINTLTELEKLLSKNAGKVIEIKKVLNSRTAKDHRLLTLLNESTPDTTITAIKQEVELVNDGMDPNLFWQIAEQYNYNAHVRWTTDGTDGLFDAVFVPAELKNIIPVFASMNLLSGHDLRDFTRAPEIKDHINIPDEVIEQWKLDLNEELPSYMVPENFVALKNFPLTPNNKIDRKALPKPNPKRSVNSDEKQAVFTENEQIIKNIWSEILGLDNLKPEDDFFKLGGHSLLAVKVMVAIEKKTGKRLPLAILFNNSTIEKLAKQLSGDEPAEKWEVIVPIRTEGPKTPLFLIHGGGLNILLFKSVSDHIDSSQPVYGIQALGLNFDTDIPPTLEEIADRYINEILKVDPDGPYAIAGYSLGGFIAFEIGKKLKAMGKEIKLLGVIDTYAGSNIFKESAFKHYTAKIKRQFRKVPFLFRSFSNSPIEAAEYQVIAAKNKLHQIFSPETVITKGISTEHEINIYRKYDVAHNNYIMAEADLKLTLFRVTKRLYYLDDPVYLGWNKFAKQGVDIVDIPGDHRTFLFPPNDKEFATIIQQVLDGKK